MDILWPMLTQVGLTLVVVLWLAYTRFSYIGKHGLSKVRDEGFPPRAINASDNFKNQFEVPVLFYVICITLALIGGANALALGLAWGFVALRIVYACIQLGPNVIFPWRFGAFFSSTIVLIALFAVTVTLLLAYLSEYPA